MTEEKRVLDRYLSPLDVWAMAFGCMVGWGVFAMPGNTFLPVAGPAGTVIAMGIGMVMALDPKDAQTAVSALEAAGEKAYVIGSVERGEKCAELI